MTDLTKRTVAQAREDLKAKRYSAEELTEAHIKQMEATRHLNAYVLETPEHALSAARETDRRLASGESLLPLDGIPLGIKDLFCTQGVRTTACSDILNDFKPPYESTVTSKLFQAGAGMLGKLNMDQFAMGSSNLTSSFGPVKSPWKAKGESKDYVPGGSSGGSASSVSAGSAMAATGTDTGGSIRQPAAFTGIVGIKPTYGRCSRFGIVAFASSLDQAGPMTKDVRDAAILLEIMAGYDPKDATSLNRPVPSFEKALSGSLKGLKVGIPKEYRVEGLSPEILKMWEDGIAWVKDAGAEVIDASLPHTKYALPTYYILAPAEASSNLARYDGVRYGHRTREAKTLDDLYELTRTEGFGEEVKRRIMIGTYVLSAGYYDAYYLKAQKVRRLISQDFIEVFKTVDFILTPTTPTPPFVIGEEPQDPITMYMNDVLTVPANLAGLPAISVPAALTQKGLPLGLQIVGRALDEETVLNAAFALEKAAAFTTQVEEMRKAS